ncbi:MAG: 50S ribosomal protein L29 [Methylotetracoccus sp.]
MKTTDLRAKSAEQLKEQLLELHKEQFTLRMQKGIGQLGKPHQLANVRRDIARINTVLTEKGAGK